ncbi:MAG: DsbA family protein [Parvibaculum sp.]|mgnify:CR=1 FL=1|nr:DsbA family protein [Parvibaculum sp.]
MFNFRVSTIASRLAAGVVTLALLVAPAPVMAAEFSKTETKAIEKIVHDYLVQNPEVMIEVMSELDARQEAAKRSAQNNAVAKHRKAIFDDPASFVMGNPKGDVTIVEFFDYNCGYCKRAFAPLMNTIKADGNVRLVLKEFPILGPSSVIASYATMAAEKQGKYFEMHKALFMHKGSLDEDEVMAVAKSVGLDIARLRRDMADPKFAKTIERNEALAQALKISGTPSFVIGDALHPGALSAEDLKLAIKDARAAKS